MSLPLSAACAARRPFGAQVADGRAEPGHDAHDLVGVGCFVTLVRMKGGWLYFMSNRRDGILYVGVTSNLSYRVWQHREGLVKGFTSRYGLKRLVYYERFEDIRDAIQREKTIKHWPRAWKVRLIHGMNPEWEDLYETLA